VAGNASEGAIFPYPANGDPVRFQQFSDKIKDKYGDNATVSIVTSMAYDATKVLAASMEKDDTSDDIKKGLYDLKDYPGVTGNITFDKNGDVVSRLFIFKIVKNGTFEDYR
jgi:branched-chain amino acid transport system substrate-binding protein